ncbi:hypothetical protein SEA_SHAM_238 [Streptomyces phage Sham]|nr:hypothetical protein SEA_SHAM_238 [Streptomyces phage Sham]
MTYSVVELTGKGPYYTQLENGTRQFLQEVTGELPRKGEFLSLRIARYTQATFRVKAIEHSDVTHPFVYVKKVHEQKY